MTSLLAAASPALALASALALAAIERRRPMLARALGGLSLAVQLLLALAAIRITHASGAASVALAGVAGGAGTLVLDRLSASMLLIVVAAFVLAWFAGGPVAGGERPHSRLQLLLLGIVTACLSGNLASLGALLLGAAWLVVARPAGPGVARRDGRRPVVGALALALGAAIASIGAATGTLDLAELAVAAPAVPSTAGLLLGGGAFGLLGVLVLAALALPLAAFTDDGAAFGAPHRAPVAVALSLACIYAILRLYTLVFPCFIAGPCGSSGLALPFGLAVATGGALAALTVARARSLAPALVTLSIGLALVAAGSFREAGLAAALFLMLHTALAAAVLSGASGLAARWRWLPVAALLCVPPLSGFIGLVAVLRASVPDALAVWTLLLGSVLVAAIGVFRRRAPEPAMEPGPRTGTVFALAGVVAGSGALLLLAAGAGGVLGIATATARQLLERSAYVTAVAAARVPGDERAAAAGR